MKKIAILVLILLSVQLFAQNTAIWSKGTPRTDAFDRLLFEHEGYVYTGYRDGKEYRIEQTDQLQKKTISKKIELPEEYKKEELSYIFPCKDFIGVFYTAYDKKTKLGYLKCMKLDKKTLSKTGEIVTVLDIKGKDWGSFKYYYRFCMSKDQSKILFAYNYEIPKDKSGKRIVFDVRDAELNPLWSTEINEKELPEEYKMPLSYCYSDRLYRNGQTDQYKKFYRVSVSNDGGAMMLLSEKVIQTSRPDLVTVDAIIVHENGYKLIENKFGEKAVRDSYEWQNGELIHYGDYRTIEPNELIGRFAIAYDETGLEKWRIEEPFDMTFLEKEKHGAQLECGFYKGV
ncbi:MAG: hypothetical protein JKY42_04640 [Flavobacteriales bacterium]|nr:hypothetical protein [Flavobacteriales bacterium]